MANRTEGDDMWRITALGLGIYFLLMGLVQPDLGSRPWWYLMLAAILIAIGVDQMLGRPARRRTIP